MIWNPIAEKVPEILYGTEIADSEAQFECEQGEPMQKFKFAKKNLVQKNLIDDYELGVIEDKILLELQLAMSSNKMASVRSSTTALDLFGDLGGFHQSIDMMVFYFGEWFAFKFFL